MKKLFQEPTVELIRLTDVVLNGRSIIDSSMTDGDLPEGWE